MWRKCEGSNVIRIVLLKTVIFPHFRFRNYHKQLTFTHSSLSPTIDLLSIRDHRPESPVLNHPWNGGAWQQNRAVLLQILVLSKSNSPRPHEFLVVFWETRQNGRAALRNHRRRFNVPFLRQSSTSFFFFFFSPNLPPSFFSPSQPPIIPIRLAHRFISREREREWTSFERRSKTRISSQVLLLFPLYFQSPRALGLAFLDSLVPSTGKPWNIMRAGCTVSAATMNGAPCVAAVSGTVTMPFFHGKIKCDDQGSSLFRALLPSSKYHRNSFREVEVMLNTTWCLARDIATRSCIEL